jgi:predicted 3-demethylubiquinone-9 3-methyltransferase (glyoxalase superfamily)
MSNLMPSLMFVGDQCGRAEEAMELYAATFPESEIVTVKRADHGILHAHARIAGRDVTVMDSPGPHAFTFTPAISLTVELPDEATIDAAWAALEDGATVLMPLGAYDFAEKFGWIQDRFGVTWQLILAP